jgi:hypothetical protein
MTPPDSFRRDLIDPPSELRGPRPTTPPLDVVTVQIGDRYPDVYVERLRNMVARHLPIPHRFIVWCDANPDGSPRRYSSGIHQRDLSDWGLPGTRSKLRLFDREIGGEAPFLFLDMTLVIRQSLLPLVRRGRGSRASLIAVQDWNYPTLNSSVMWLNPDVNTQRVWDRWIEEGQHTWTIRGDQNYINAVFRREAPEALTFWAMGRVASYKRLRKLAATDPDLALAKLREAIILKFHGRPKPTDVLDPWANPRSTVLRHPLTPRLWRFLDDEIRAHWR